MGTFMSGVPSCANTEASRHTTIEWMMLCGWITTRIFSGARSNSQRASITSSALFIIVAESTEILRPITQFGCATAWAGVTPCRVSWSHSRKGPPLAVSTMWSMRAAQACRSSGRHWKIAECSLSMGSSVAPDAATACMKSAPPTTRASLLASSSRLPARAAAMQAGRPAAPTMAAITLSTPGSQASSHRACGPTRTSVDKRSCARPRRASSARASLGTTTTRGRNRWHCANSRSTR